jgi:hypothetical protein
LAPWRAADTAAHTPDKPPPTTITSPVNSRFVMTLLFFSVFISQVLLVFSFSQT